jgi:Major Facilitator Superfamily
MFTAERAAAARADRLPAARRWFIAVAVFGMVGHGVWVPLMFLFFTQGRGLPLAGAGTAVTVGGCAALVFGTTVTWRVIDRIGPFRAKALAGVCDVPAFVGYLVTHNLAEVAVFSALAATAASLFFAADPEAVRRISLDEQQRVHTFALLTSLRVIGFGLGAVLATLGLVLDVGARWVWDVMVLLIAVVNLASAVLFWSLRHVDDIWLPDVGGAADEPPRYRDVLRQGWFMVFIGGTFVVALVTIGMDVTLPVYLLSLGLPRWSATVSYLVMCVLIALAAQLVSRLSRVVGQLRLLIGAAIILATAYLVLIGLTAVHGKMGLLLVLATGLILFSLADAISNALASNVMLSFAPAASSGRHASLLQTAWALASTVAPGVYARLFTAARTLPWGFSAALLVVSAAAYTAVHRSRPGR